MRVYFFLGGIVLQMTSFLQDKQLTIALSGEIDHHGAKNSLQNIADKIDQYMPMLCILDFGDITFMDSSGIAVVIHTLRRMNEIGGVLKLKNLPPQPWKVFKAAGMERIVDMERSVSLHEV